MRMILSGLPNARLDIPFDHVLTPDKFDITWADTRATSEKLDASDSLTDRLLNPCNI